MLTPACGSSRYETEAKQPEIRIRKRFKDRITALAMWVLLTPPGRWCPSGYRLIPTKKGSPIFTHTHTPMSGPPNGGVSFWLPFKTTKQGVPPKKTSHPRGQIKVQQDSVGCQQYSNQFCSGFRPNNPMPKQGRSLRLGHLAIYRCLKLF